MRRLCLSLLLVMMGCGAALRAPHPVAADATRAGVELESLAQGRQIYLSKCTSCHLPVAPKKFTPPEWVGHVDEMREEAKLNDTEYELILDYLQTMSTAPESAR